MARSTKPTQSAKAPQRKRTRSGGSSASPRSTGGAGFAFEDQVGAWLLVRMMTGADVPGVGAVGDALQTQTGSLGWILDDLLASAPASSGERVRLAISCKSNVQVTANGLPEDFVTAAWRQWRQTGVFNRDRDAIALVTRGHHPRFAALWSDIKAWCDGGETATALSRINQHGAHRAVFDSVKNPGRQDEQTVHDEDVIALITRLQILPLDFQMSNSTDEEEAVAACRRLVDGEGAEEGLRLWNALIDRVRDARLGNGSIALGALWDNLSRQFSLKDHPDFAASWRLLEAISQDHLATIDDVLPSGHRVARSGEQHRLQTLIADNASVAVYGESGSGKSALVKSTLDTQPGWKQVWFGPEELATALNASKRAAAGFAHPLADILARSPNTENVLVIDAAERLAPESDKRVTALMAELLARNAPGQPPRWRAIIVGQTVAVASGRLQILVGANQQTMLEVGGVSHAEVHAALRSTQRLGWLSGHSDTVRALTNLRTLAWVIQADTAFSESGGPVSHTEIADRLWRHWTGDNLPLQSLVMRLADREASFERSFAVSELAPIDLAVLQNAPHQLPLRRNNHNRYEFTHDLASDWARFQRLKEIAADTQLWGRLATNPLWNSALRMLGQALLREQHGGRNAWDAAFEKLETAKKDLPLAADVLLDALFLDPLADNFLNERLELLLAANGALLNRLLRRFLHVATVAGFNADALQVDPSMRVHLEHLHRVPIYGRWPPLARFLSRHQPRIAGLLSPDVAKVCETWLFRTPQNLNNGKPTPYRREFAELSMAAAREMQAHEGRFLGARDVEDALYTAALLAAAELPDEVAAWALEMVGRRPFRADVMDRITQRWREEREAREERLRNDPNLRARQARMRDYGPSFDMRPARLPPWPLGPKHEVDTDFPRVCTRTRALENLFRARPKEASEILLAATIEAAPRESSYGRLSDDLRLKHDQGSYPTVYWKSAFSTFLVVNADEALTSLLSLVNFCTERWMDPDGKATASIDDIVGISIAAPDGSVRRYSGNAMVFDWPQSSSMHSGQLYCALAALERWLCERADNGESIHDVLVRILAEGRSVSLLGVLVGIGKRHPALFRSVLRPLLASHEIFEWDEYRVNSLGFHFDAFAWHRSGGEALRAAQAWHFESHHQAHLGTVVINLLLADEDLAEFVQQASHGWPASDDPKSNLERRILKARLDRRNYMMQSERGPVFILPEDIQTDIQAFRSENAPSLEAMSLPMDCEEEIWKTGPLDDGFAERLGNAFTEILPHQDAPLRSHAEAAIAATLLVRGSAWLDRHPDVRAKAEAIIEERLTRVGETRSALTQTWGLAVRDSLTFAAHAAMAEWTRGGRGSERWGRRVLQLLTSWHDAAQATIMRLGYRDAHILGSRWKRLCDLAILWSGLTILAPRPVEGESDSRWNRWLSWLRSRSLDVEPGIRIEPVDIAKRIERIQRARWRRLSDAGRRGNWDPETRHSSGLDIHILSNVFAFTLRDEFVDVARDSTGTHDLLLDLLAFEVWRRYEDVDSDGEHGPPGELSYAIATALARETRRVLVTDGQRLWQPLFDLGADGYHIIEHFIGTWFLKAAEGSDRLFIEHWRAMVEYAMRSPTWRPERRWYRGQELYRAILGFGFEFVLKNLAGASDALREMTPSYREWAATHLTSDEDSVKGFAYFLSSDAGAVLRPDGLKWMAEALRERSQSVAWRREEVGAALLDLVTNIAASDVGLLRNNSSARENVLAIVALLVAKQVPASLVLQERVRDLLL